MSFRSLPGWLFLLMFSAPGCGRDTEGMRLGREYAEYIAPAAGAERRDDIAAHFARGYVDRIRNGPMEIHNSAMVSPPASVNWREEDRLAYWRGYLRGGSILVEERDARGRRATAMWEAAGLTAILAVPFWWMRRRMRLQNRGE